MKFARSIRPYSCALLLVTAGACGALLTEATLDADLLDVPLDGLSSTDLAAFARGDAEFSRPFSVREGLGPIFNDLSCAACHSGDGRGRPENVLTRIGTPADGFLASLGGPQIQSRAIPGASPEVVPVGVTLSLRLPPPVFGVGLIEAVPEAALLALADSADTNRDGISGRPNWVVPAAYVPGLSGARRIGRFGRKGQTATLLEQTVDAYHQDMGITTEQHPNDNLHPNDPASASDRANDPEIPSATVAAVVAYLRMLAPPAPGPETPDAVRGRALFTQAGCSACHVPTLTSGDAPIPALRGRTVTLYSDLLLHDMGPRLADARPDGSATGTEWKTPPLWGLRLMTRFLNGQAFLLHDGRARSIAEAIDWHGGEADRARTHWLGLSPADQRALLAFVGSR